MSFAMRIYPEKEIENRKDYLIPGEVGIFLKREGKEKGRDEAVAPERCVKVFQEKIHIERDPVNATLGVKFAKHREMYGGEHKN